MLCILQQDVMLQLINGMERRIHPVWPCTGPGAPRLNPGRRREVRSRNPSDLLKHGQCRQPPPQANSPMWRLGSPRTSDGDPIYPQHRRVAVFRAVTGQKAADRQQSCIRLRPFNFVILSPSLASHYNTAPFRAVAQGSDSGLDSHRPGTLPSRPRQRAALVVPVPCHAVIRALAPPCLVRPCPR